MKNQPNLSELSKEELQKRLKTAGGMTGIFLAIVAVQLADGIYLTTQQGFNVFIVIPLAFIPLLLVNINNVKKIKEEIAKRK
jgi:hypothetical protein